MYLSGIYGYNKKLDENKVVLRLYFLLNFIVFFFVGIMAGKI